MWWQLQEQMQKAREAGDGMIEPFYQETEDKLSEKTKREDTTDNTELEEN